MHHHNNVRNPHQVPHNSHIRPHNPMNMMPPRSQIIPFISTQQPRDLNRLGPHIPQQHSQQRMNTQMHQNPQIHHSKNRIISNHNNNNSNAVLHGTGVVPGPSIKQQSTPIHPQILQNISHNYPQKIITGNHHGKSSLQPAQHQPKLNDEKHKEQIRSINDSIPSYNQHQQPQQQHQNPRRNIPNHILNSKQNQLSHLPQQQQQQLQQQQQQSQKQQQTHQKQPKPQPKITLLTHNNSHPKILKNPNTPQVRKSPPLITTIPNVATTSTPPKTILSNASTKINNVQSNCPVPIISSQQKVSNTIQTSVVENSSDKVSSQNQMAAPISPIIEQQAKQIVSTTKEEYTCGQILQSPTIENFTNSKDKTPMCLVNELARFNKIGHQYRLTGEQGPAHSKRFTVTLKLGDEEYTADGPSIKKTQHTAASEAIAKTKYEHPPAKTIRHKNGTTRTGTATLTPTVELNALAMKLGEPTIYVFDSSTSNNSQSVGGNNVNGVPLPPHHPISNNYSHQQTQGSNVFPENGQYQVLNHRNNIYLNGGMHPRFPSHRGRGSFGQRGTFLKYNQNARLPFNGMMSGYAKDACKITLMVGKKKFVGIGPTIQSAKHDAAAKALEILKPLGEESTNHDNNVTTDIDDPNSDSKSPISLVHEMALKRNLNVTFAVKGESGPPHMKVFRTICTVGTIVTDGEGNGKKVSKKRAAEKMLEELKKIPAIVIEKPIVVLPTTVQQNISNGKIGKVKNSKRLNAVQVQGQTPTTGRKKSKNLIKENSDTENSEVFNPILKLTKIQQMLKEREPTYAIVEERGAPRRREFVVMVTAGNMSTEGVGYSKKLAKKNAAKNLITLMGYDPVSVSNKENDSNIVNTAEKINNSEIDKKTQSQKEIVNSSLNNNNNNSNNSPTVSQSGNSSRQIVPGIIHLPQNKINSMETDQIKTNNKSQQPQEEQEQQSVNDNLSESQNNNVANESPLPSPSPPPSPKSNSPILEKKVSSSTDFAVRPKDQLLYLAQLLGFQAVFSDYPKGNHGEYLTIVTLSTDPPQICHGAGADTDASQDIAARTALQMLSKLGLDNVCPKEKTSQKKSSKVLAAADSSKN